MGITGNLKTMQLAELLQWLSQSKKTGTLVIDDGAVDKRIFFEDGRIVSSSSSDPREYLGQFLISRGHITDEEMNGAIQMQEKTGMLLGKILVSIGAVEKDEVHEILRLKAEEAIYDLFTWEEADFEFLDDELPEREMIPISLDVTGIVLEGARRVDEWSRIRTRIPSLDAIVVTIADDPIDPELTLSEQQVLAYVEDGKTVERIRDQSHATEFFVCRVLFDAAERGDLKVLLPPWERPGKDEERAGAPEKAEQKAAPAAAAPTEIDAQLLIDSAGPHLEEGRFEQALRHLRAARELDPYSREVKAEAEKVEKQVRDALAEAGVTVDATPTLTRSMEELTTSQLSRNEGFVLSRINGSYDIANIVKISSLPELDALLAFWRLKKAGHIELV